MRWHELPLNPPPRTLRSFALCCFIFFSAAAVWRLRLDDNSTAVALFGLALSVGLLGLLRPRILRPVFAAAMLATFPIGWLFSHLLLLALFTGIFVPLGIFFRLIGRDALALRLRPEYKSYWSDKRQSNDVRGYFRMS